MDANTLKVDQSVFHGIHLVEILEKLQYDCHSTKSSWYLHPCGI